MTELERFEPLNEFILVELPQISSKTESGIIKPVEMIEAEKKNNDSFLKIIAIDPDIVTDSLKIGSRIMVNMHQMTALKLDGKDYGYLPRTGALGLLRIEK